MIEIDQYSVSTVPLEMLFDNTSLSLGTGFFWRSVEDVFLITNWHNLSGKNPHTGEHLSDTLAEPNKIRVWCNVRNQLGSKKPVELTLRDDDDRPLWHIHPIGGRRVDVVALPVVLPADVDPSPINQMEHDNLVVQVGMDVFVLGYPYGITQGGFPVWKRASIATEPGIAEANLEKRILLDTASRPGMSGSPVIRRSWGTHMMDNGTTSITSGTATRFVGVYSGRLVARDTMDAQLGIAWPAVLVSEIVAGNRRDDPV